jgi:hypothetical protein
VEELHLGAVAAGNLQGLLVGTSAAPRTVPGSSEYTAAHNSGEWPAIGNDGRRVAPPPLTGARRRSIEKQKRCKLCKKHKKLADFYLDRGKPRAMYIECSLAKRRGTLS